MILNANDSFLVVKEFKVLTIPSKSFLLQTMKVRFNWIEIAPTLLSQ
jgi:hypothetical protein